MLSLMKLLLLMSWVSPMNGNPPSVSIARVWAMSPYFVESREQRRNGGATHKPVDTEVVHPKQIDEDGFQLVNRNKSQHLLKMVLLL